MLCNQREGLAEGRDAVTYEGRGDPSVARKFLARLAGKEPVTIQTFDDQQPPRKRLTRILHGTLESDADASEFITLNQEGAGIFVMVNAGNGVARLRT